MSHGIAVCRLGIQRRANVDDDVERKETPTPNQWVLIECTELDDDLRVVDGKVLAHTYSRSEVEKQLTTLRNEKIAVEFTGDRDTGEA